MFTNMCYTYLVYLTNRGIIQERNTQMSENNNRFLSEDDESFERKIYEEQKKSQEAATQNELNKQKEREQKAREQENARAKQLMQEKLELMKLKSGVIEESEMIKKEKAPEIVMTPKQKVSNFFYHYKAFVFIGIFVLAVVAVFIWQLSTKEKVDMYVISTCNNGLEFRVDSLEKYLESFCPDINGDGVVNVQVISAPESSDYQVNSANQTKIIGQLQMDETIMILTNDGNYSTSREYDESTGEAVYVFAGLLEDMRSDFPENDSVDEKGYHFYGDSIKKALNWEEMPDDIILSLRTPVKPLHGDKETMQKNYDTAFEILRKIMKDNGDL